MVVVGGGGGETEGIFDITILFFVFCLAYEIHGVPTLHVSQEGSPSARSQTL